MAQNDGSKDEKPEKKEPKNPFNASKSVAFLNHDIKPSILKIRSPRKRPRERSDRKTIFKINSNDRGLEKSTRRKKEKSIESGRQSMTSLTVSSTSKSPRGKKKGGNSKPRITNFAKINMDLSKIKTVKDQLKGGKK